VDYRTGTRALILTSEGLEGAIVCPSCAAGGVLIVSVKHRHGDQSAILEAKREAAKTKREHLAPFIHHLEGQLRMQKTGAAQGSPEYQDVLSGKIEQLEAVIALLKEGRT
jgi:hypothetical protein